MKTKFLKKDNLYSFDGTNYKYKNIIPLSSTRYIIANTENKYGLMDNNENAIIICQHYYIQKIFGNILFFIDYYPNPSGIGDLAAGYLYDLNGNLLDKCQVYEQQENYDKLNSIIRVANNENMLNKRLIGLYNNKGKRIADIKYNGIYRIVEHTYEEFYIGWIDERDNDDKHYYDHIDKNGNVNTFCISTKQKYLPNVNKLKECRFYKDYVIVVYDDGYDYTDKGKICEVKYHRPDKKYIINSEGIFIQIDDYKLFNKKIEYLIDNEWKTIY